MVNLPYIKPILLKLTRPVLEWIANLTGGVQEEMIPYSFASTLHFALIFTLNFTITFKILLLN